MATVAIVEDHRLLAETLCAALAMRDVTTTIIEPGPLTALHTALTTLSPDLVLLDLDLGPHGDSTALIGTLHRAGIRVLVISGTADSERLALAYEAGAFGCQSKAAGFDVLLERIEQSLVSATPLDAAQRRHLLDELARTRGARGREAATFRSLTERERDTLAELGAGRSVAEIARTWVVSEATVRSHVRGLLVKLGAKSQLAAVAHAMRCGWLGAAARR